MHDSSTRSEGDTQSDPRPIYQPEPPAFQIDVRPDRERVLVCPSGDLDLATADTVEAQIQELLERGFDRVVIDLRSVTFLDSTGIRTLIAGHKRARAGGQMLSVILGGLATRRPLELSGMDRVLDVESDGAGAP